MLALLSRLREKVVIGFVGGSDLVKQQEQLGVNGLDGKLTHIRKPQSPSPDGRGTGRRRRGIWLT